MNKTAQQLIKLGTEHPELRPHIRPVLAAMKQARAQGPVMGVLHKYWNTVHDMERELKDVAREYDHAASYSDGPGKKGAEKMIKMIEDVVKSLEDISMKQLGKLTDEEAKWVREHGEPDDYAAEQSAKMFPR